MGKVIFGISLVLAAAAGVMLYCVCKGGDKEDDIDFDFTPSKPEEGGNDFDIDVDVPEESGEKNTAETEEEES